MEKSSISMDGLGLRENSRAGDINDWVILIKFIAEAKGINMITQGKQV